MDSGHHPTQAKGTARGRLILLASIVLVVGLAAALVFVLNVRARVRTQAAADSAHHEVLGAVLNAQGAVQRHRAEQALASASDQLRAALASTLSGREAFGQRAFVRAVADGRIDRAEALLTWWTPPDDEADVCDALARLHLDQGRHAEALQTAEAAIHRFSEQRPRFVRLSYDAMAADQGLRDTEPVDLGADPQLTRIRTFDVASSVLLRVYAGGDTVAVFKPLQTNPWTNYRGEIATYRLCQLIGCAISIPRTVEARIRDTDLARLMRLDSVDDIARNNYRPIWVTDDDGQRWLYGALKDWVPGFVYFPIEETAAWRDLVRPGRPLAPLQRLGLREALDSFAGSRPDWYPRFLDRARGLNAADFAHQLSDMHVIDVLSNNWDRYSSRDPSSNCQWNHGQFVSIDNGATFHLADERTGQDVQVRMRRIGLFSRSLIEAIRWMEPEALFPLAFPPNAHIDREDERWQDFLDRREWLLEYVDGLIEQHGADEVLVFE